jgi:hypothetical protein
MSPNLPIAFGDALWMKDDAWRFFFHGSMIARVKDQANDR